MTWASRIRLLAGTFLVLAVAAVATLNLNDSRGRATSDSAQILAETYAVGTPYAGLVADQLVDVGDVVAEGDPLFVIDSASLTYDLTNGLVSDPPEFTQLDENGRLVVLASGAGRLTQVAAARGTFVPPASTLATVQREGMLHVQAEYTLTAKEYARLPGGADVTIMLPNEATLEGHVEQVDVTTVDGQAQAVVRIASDTLVDGAANGLVSAGTPVVTQIKLTNDGVVTTVAESLRTYVDGLRR
ncbi:HlyD family efflux transporter periplasmic adaptor subunit [Cellulomonas dongxiuzhuiae]|uniref:HlyD family efflux transporter periplasmic adaptor subunit n=1 Tax=Cellulomonas dongxiuzhuiae TaxID=2819979 RepID=A0ABX8GK81_9CELL|nr:HlyD family efflux transporter periplasmic adaptor subunit [Cellulomonas dongxiuzhuiae]MBO3095623.1 HlyD family efflux transporter periplasmic adaptor subunit [Cellulomonas dongxiuzhuiae]QWC16589.1 HlyD family efflux transporter periplasmic adaptor subunit [Cellulomonas dongxiuzhuiae]